MPMAAEFLTYMSFSAMTEGFGLPLVEDTHKLHRLGGIGEECRALKTGRIW